MPAAVADTGLAALYAAPFTLVCRSKVDAVKVDLTNSASVQLATVSPAVMPNTSPPASAARTLMDARGLPDSAETVMTGIRPRSR
jgi:hypothetical protein